MKEKRGPVSLLIVDDHPHYRRALRASLDMEDDICVIADASEWTYVERIIESQRPDVVLMDIRIPFTDTIRDGIDATRYIRTHYPYTAVIMISMLAENKYKEMSYAAGAAAY